MGIEAKFTRDDVKRRFDRFLNEIELMQVEALQELGEMCVKHAREIPSTVGFEDQTGNLRSSIGYIVFKDGVAVHEGYKAVKGGAEGVKAGIAIAEKAGARYKEGVVLVVTAGMNYAVYVESKGRDVLTSAELLAKQVLPRMVQELKDNISKAKQ